MTFVPFLKHDVYMVNAHFASMQACLPKFFSETFYYIQHYAVSTLRPIWATTLLQPGYDIFILWNWPKTSSCQLPCQRHSSSADCTRKLLKGSNESASLLVCTQNNFFDWNCRFFVSDVIREVVLGPFWLMLPGLGPNR